MSASLSAARRRRLKRSGLFEPIDKGAFIEKISDTNSAPRFEDWKVIDAQALVTGHVSQEADGRLRAEFRLWGTFGGQQLIGEQYFANKANTRRVAHIIADAIYERLTGEKGYFDTRIVFIDESGPKNKRQKPLAIMDQDGAGVRYLSDGRSIALTPRFSPTRQEITYMSYESGQPQVYLLQIETGQRELVGNFPGMTFAPRFSPDGQKVAHEPVARRRQFQHLCDGPAQPHHHAAHQFQRPSTLRLPIRRTAARWCSPRIAAAARRSTSWAPTAPARTASRSATAPIRRRCGRRAAILIAFTKQTGGDFQIGVMKTDGSGERILSTGFQQEGPTWAPNGRVLMFFREAAGSGGPHLYLGRPDRPQRAVDSDRQLCFRPRLVAVAGIAQPRSITARKARISTSAPRFGRILANGARRNVGQGTVAFGMATATRC